MRTIRVIVDAHSNESVSHVAHRRQEDRRTAGAPPVIVCVCHRVSDRDIEREVRHGCASFEELQDELRVGTACGRCTDCARDTFDVTRACRPAAADTRAANAARVIPIAATVRAQPTA
jgi:bacterioferritin-associated ferredoxin